MKAIDQLKQQIEIDIAAAWSVDESPDRELFHIRIKTIERLSERLIDTEIFYSFNDKYGCVTRVFRGYTADDVYEESARKYWCRGIASYSRLRQTLLNIREGLSKRKKTTKQKHPLNEG